jgi:hypothetical protein
MVGKLGSLKKKEKKIDQRDPHMRTRGVKPPQLLQYSNLLEHEIQRCAVHHVRLLYSFLSLGKRDEIYSLQERVKRVPVV